MRIRLFLILMFVSGWAFAKSETEVFVGNIVIQQTLWSDGTPSIENCTVYYINDKEKKVIEPINDDLKEGLIVANVKRNGDGNFVWKDACGNEMKSGSIYVETAIKGMGKQTTTFEISTLKPGTKTTVTQSDSKSHQNFFADIFGKSYHYSYTLYTSLLYDVPVEFEILNEDKDNININKHECLEIKFNDFLLKEDDQAILKYKVNNDNEKENVWKRCPDIQVTPNGKALIGYRTLFGEDMSHAGEIVSFRVTKKIFDGNDREGTSKECTFYRSAPSYEIDEVIATGCGLKVKIKVTDGLDLFNEINNVGQWNIYYALKKEMTDASNPTKINMTPYADNDSKNIFVIDISSDELKKLKPTRNESGGYDGYFKLKMSLIGNDEYQGKYQGLIVENRDFEVDNIYEPITVTQVGPNDDSNNPNIFYSASSYSEVGEQYAVLKIDDKYGRFDYTIKKENDENWGEKSVTKETYEASQKLEYKTLDEYKQNFKLDDNPTGKEYTEDLKKNWQSFYTKKYEKWFEEYCKPKKIDIFSQMSRKKEWQHSNSNEYPLLMVYDEDKRKSYFFWTITDPKSEKMGIFAINNVSKEFVKDWYDNVKQENYEIILDDKQTIRHTILKHKGTQKNVFDAYTYTNGVDVSVVKDNTNFKKYFSDKDITSVTYIDHAACKVLVRTAENKYHEIHVCGDGSHFYHNYSLPLTSGSSSEINGYKCGIFDSDGNVVYWDGNFINTQSNIVTPAGPVKSIKYASEGWVEYEISDGGIKYRQYVGKSATPNQSIAAWKNEFYSIEYAKYLSKQGYRLKNIEYNKQQNYILTDSYGCETKFAVCVYSAKFKEISKTPPTKWNAADGSLKLKYEEGPTIIYNEKEYTKGQEIYVDKLSATGKLAFKVAENSGNMLYYEYSIGRGIDDVSVTYCSSQGYGRIYVSADSDNKDTSSKEFILRKDDKIVMTSGQTNANSYTFNEVYAGEYQVCVELESGDVTVPWPKSINITENTFSINQLTVTDANEFEGNGSAIVTLNNQADCSVVWMLDGKTEANVDWKNIKPGSHKVEVTLDGYCKVSKEFEIKQPKISGSIGIKQDNNKCTIDISKVKVENGQLKIFCNDSEIKNTFDDSDGCTFSIPEQESTYLLKFCVENSSKVYELANFTLSKNSPLKGLSTTHTFAQEQSCPEKPMLVSISGENVVLLYNGYEYTDNKINLNPNAADTKFEYKVIGRKIESKQYGEYSVDVIYEKEDSFDNQLNFVKEFSGNYYIDNFDCNYSETTLLHIESLTGGVPNGNIEYSFDGNNWNKYNGGSIEVKQYNNDVSAQVYTYQLYLKNQGCMSQKFTDIHTVSRPSKVSIAYTKNDPSCRDDDGSITVTPSGGSGQYIMSVDEDIVFPISREEFEDNKTFISPESSNKSYTFSGDKYGTSGVHTLYILDDNFCKYTEEIKLKKYTNPSVKSAYSDPVSCYGLDDGKIKDIKIETNGELNGNDVYAKSLLYYSFFEPKNSNFYDAKEEIGLEGTISEIDNLAAGTYNLRVVDNNDCVTETGSELTIDVHQPYPLDVMVKEDKIEITERDGNDGAISVQVSGGNIGLDEITLTTEDGDEQRVLTSNTNVLQPVKGLKAGKYVVTVKDKKGCEMPEEKEPVVVELKQPDSKLSADVSSTDGLCAAMIGSITVHPTGGWGDYMITVSGEGVERVANENSEDAVFDGLKAGTYQVDVVDRNGARRRYEQVVESPEPISHKLIKSPVTCDDNGSVKIEITGGRGSYKSQMEGDEIVHDGDDVVYSDLKSHKEYVLLTTDENECEAKLTFTLDDDAMEIDIDDEYFQNENEGKYGVKIHASVNGGVAPYTYSWSQIGNVPSEVFSTDAEAVIYRSGIYELTVKDALCTKSVVHDVAIGYDQKMIVEELHNQTSTTANGRVVLISDQTDFTSLTVFCGTEKMDIGDLQWSDKRLTIDNLSGGSYSVEGVLQDGTRRMATFYIEPYIEMQKEYVHVKNVSRAGADDGSIEVKFWGGIAPYGVSISNKADDYHDSVDTEENHVKFDNLGPAEYLITVTDGGNNIFGFETIYVNAPEIPLTLTCVENSPTKCYGDSNAEIKLKATGGWSHYRYADSKDMEYVGNMVFGGLPASNRRFYVIDEYGVKDSVDVIVTQPDELRATIASIDSLRCYMDPDGGAITFDITGGNGDYRIKYLSEDRDMHLGNKLEGLPSDDYKVTFTDRNQCTSPDMIEFHIPQPDMLEIANLDIVNTTCELDNGKIDIEMKGGSLPYRYDWKENGKSYTNNKNIGLTHTKAEGLLQRGLYAIEISDSHECRTKTDDIRIVESHNPRIAQDGVHTTDALCNGSSDGIAYVDSSDVIMGFPASPFKLTWPQGQDNVMGVSTLPAGPYEVIISDENNCSTSSQFTIGEPAAIVNRLVGLRNAWCYGYSDGRIETATTGGIGDYKYLWNTGEETTYLDSIKAGVYTVVVTDEHECTDTAKYEVGEPEKLIVDLGDDVLICPGNVYVFDGGEYTTYSWTKAETGDEKESGRYFATGEEGVYALQVTNDIGCFARDTVRLSIGNDALIANFLMASDAAVNDTILLVELSNMPVDSIRWEYDVDSFKSLTFDDDESYQFNLSAENTGRFYVTMWAYSGGCESFEQKYIDIFEACEDSSDFKIGYDPLIKSAKISPNPNDGEFDLMIKLREESDVDVTIHDVHDGKQIEHVVLNGMDTYNTRLNIRQWGSGIFVLKITAGNEGRVIKVLTTR